MKLISWSEAKTAGLSKYFTGKKCKHGHISERYTSGGGCITCQLDNAKRIRIEHPERNREYMRKLREVYPTRAHVAVIKSRYGISWNQYQEMLTNQKNVCAICGSNSPGGIAKYWSVDHCHRTKIVRGLLCHQCNVMLGNAKDNPDILRTAAAYLERFTCVSEAA